MQEKTLEKQQKIRDEKIEKAVHIKSTDNVCIPMMMVEQSF